jgi:hephaestin
MSRLPGRRLGPALLALVALVATTTASTGAGPAAAGSGTVRRYFIAADTVRWNYAPSGENLITGLPFGADDGVYTVNGPNRIGSTYLKSLYREYTDASFTQLKPRPPEWEHLGDLGPVIHAEVGDTIEVVFRNNTPFPASMHPHGVFYDKNSEGAPYADGTSGADQADDAVPPGATYTYHWAVPERAGPGPMDGSSVMWMYHSHSNEAADVYSGLMGAIVITRKGMARADGTPKDVDREFVVNYEVDNENASLYLERNIATFAGKPKTVNKEDGDFQESNLMHSINGYVFGNLPGLTMKAGQHVRWYVMAMGTEVDLHTPHWHGNTLTVNGMRTDVVNLLPAQMTVADMVPDDPGTWLYHCHVADHIHAGMLSLYTVLPA